MRKLFIVFFVIIIIILTTVSCSCLLPGKAKNKHPRESFLFMDRQSVILSCVGPNCRTHTEAVTGSGFMIGATKDGTLGLTAGHVCDPSIGDKAFWLKTIPQSTTMKATLFSGKTSPASILAVYKKEDLCVFLLEGVFLPYIPLAKKGPVYGDDVHTLAAPLGIYEPKAVPIFTGQYFGVFDRLDTDVYSIPTIFGSSGSPILNSSGELIGVTSRAYPAFPHVCISPRFKYVHRLVSAIEDGYLPYSLSREGI